MAVRSVLLFFTLSVIVYITGGALGQETYFISVGRSGTFNNEIFLTCRTSNGRSLSDSVFCRNGETFLETRVTAGNELRFTIDRQREGNFSCGERTAFGSILKATDGPMLLPFPDNAILQPQQFSASTGDTARINCSVVPGDLVNQYTVRWRNASDMSQVFFERSRFRRQGLNDRYSVDDRTFALLIDNVEPSDAANPYVCEVSVFIASQDRLYDNSRTTNQTLTVFEAPAFVVSPSSVTVAANEAKNATFLCEVRSSPRPSTITWFHQTNTGRIQVMTSSDHYCIRSNNIPTVDGHQVRSELTVVGVASKDTGDIICQAKYDESEDASTTTQSTTLTVISVPTGLKVIYTEEGVFLYEVSLTSPLPIPVRVDLWFSDAVTGDEVRILIREFFYNSVTLRGFRQGAPFSRFRVQVRIVFGDDVTVGPFRNQSTVYDKVRPGKLNMWIIICGVACTVLLIIIGALIIVVVRLNGQLSGIIAGMMKEKHHSRNIDDMSHEEKPASDSAPSSGPAPSSGIESDSSANNVPRRSSRFWCCKRSGVSRSMASAFIENLKKIIKFGLADATISEQLKQVGVRDEVWPLVPEESSTTISEQLKQVGVRDEVWPLVPEESSSTCANGISTIHVYEHCV